MFNPLPVVLADYRRNKTLIFSTVLLIALAVAIGIAVIAQERAIRQGSAAAADDFDLIVGAHGSPTQLVLTSVYLQLRAIPLLDKKVLQEVTDAPGVTYAAPIAFGDSFKGYPIVGTTNRFANRDGRLPLIEGRLMLRRGEALIGAKLPFALGDEISPSHGMHVDEDDDEHGDAEDSHAAHKDVHYTVVGKLAARNNHWDKAIIIPVEDVWSAHGQPTGHAPGELHIGPPWNIDQLSGVPALAVKPDSVASAYRLRNQFRTTTSQALFPAEVLNELYSTLGDIRDMMSLMALATQILVIAAVLMALLTGFLARQRQFAVLRAMGASASYVFTVIWCEVSVLILLGTVLGIGFGVGASSLLASALEHKFGFAMPISLGKAELTMIFGLILSGGVIATIPAIAGFKRSISAGLKN